MLEEHFIQEHSFEKQQIKTGSILFSCYLELFPLQ